MPSNPLIELQRLFNEGLVNSITQVQQFVFRKNQDVQPEASRNEPIVTSVPRSPPELTKENLGRSTWTLLHTVAAQYPQKPNKRQRKDVEALVRWGISSNAVCFPFVAFRLAQARCAYLADRLPHTHISMR